MSWEWYLREIGGTGLRILPDLEICSLVGMRFYERTFFVWNEKEQRYYIAFNYEDLREGFNDEQIEGLCHELEHYYLTKLLKTLAIPTRKGLYPEWITSNPSFIYPHKSCKPQFYNSCNVSDIFPNNSFTTSLILAF